MLAQQDLGGFKGGTKQVNSLFRENQECSSTTAAFWRLALLPSASRLVATT
jgi:hypothetical protein